MKIKTDRLILRRFRADDATVFATLNADPLVMRYFPAVLTREQSDDFLTRILTYYDTHPDGWFAVEADGEFIGFSGIVEIGYDAPFTPATEIGWRLIPSAWGKGYATEAARACLQYGFDIVGLDEIVAMTTHQNTPSQRVMQRLHMTRDPADDFDHPRLDPDSHLLRHVLYRLTREQWLASAAL